MTLDDDDFPGINAASIDHEWTRVDPIAAITLKEMVGSRRSYPGIESCLAYHRMDTLAANGGQPSNLDATS